MKNEYGGQMNKFSHLPWKCI